ncbi:SDR family oxidoreductase [Conexibacter woesei]|uniref:Short-chain dehydrogenase/reductase SDR n=1 Tax=Conexibacter woesei (strain DSM 14684 / CCUG 47730 / CIP 108061 / JCM 11494 / NBRC 100937 / ID131577) TaxID=469383 RepID=D3F8Z1_CONWI|nr:SDR family NAD(P)-dependent oxidoreductase [Conexibacter woesei]ADB52986.1 short-chain dehydrogenase/reductase SDR [Conexibacter woesei DSM 14684]
MPETNSSPPDLSGLRDRVALVTGGASGIGRATALALAAAGVEVVVADLDAAQAQEVARQVGGHAFEADVSDLDANRAAVAFAQERCGGLDLAFLNAGVTSGCGVGEDFDLALYRRAMGVNLDGVVFGTHAALPALRARGGGAIVATASLAGLVGVPLEPIYTANKHAVVGLTRSLGPTLAAEGIRFNAVCPGFAETPLIADFRDGLRDAGFELLSPEVVAETAVHLFAGEMSGECWFVQVGREPAPFGFRGIPGPRTTEVPK